MNNNRTMMQYFEWYLPDNELHWKRVAAQAPALKAAGINMVWLPPAYKGAAGKSSVGKYSVFRWNASHFSGTDWDDAGKRNGGCHGETVRDGRDWRRRLG